MTQLYLLSYRPTGLLEHAHATVFFIALGSILAAMLYARSGYVCWLVLVTICSATVTVAGFRLALAAHVVTLLSALILTVYLDPSPLIRNRVLTMLAALSVVTVIVLCLDPTQAVQKYYLPAFMRGDFQVPEKNVGTWVLENSQAVVKVWPVHQLIHGDSFDLIHLLFGHGIAGTLSGNFPWSDDLFLLALMLQFGLLGSLAFFGAWILAFRIGVLGILKARKQGLGIDEKFLLVAPWLLLLLLAASMLHSGVLQRKAIFPVFPLAAGILWRFRPTTQLRTSYGSV